jgi:hypothetical protein
VMNPAVTSSLHISCWLPDRAAFVVRRSACICGIVGIIWHSRSLFLIYVTIYPFPPVVMTHSCTSWVREGFLVSRTSC